MKTPLATKTAFLPIFVGLALFLLLPAVSHATVVVEWGPKGWITQTTNLTMPSPQSADSGLTNIYGYSDSIAITPSSHYSAPTGKSGPFYGGSWVSTSDGLNNTWRLARMFDWNDSLDRLEFDTETSFPTGTTVSAGIFVAFLKDDFLNGLNSTPVYFDSGSSMRADVRTLAANPSTFHFALQDGNQWYISQHSVSSNTTLSLDSSAILDSTWGAWSPTGGANGRLEGVPVTFDTLGSEFTDIQGVGLFSYRDGQEARLQSALTYFEVVAIPEGPTTPLAIAFIAAITALVLRRIKR